MTPGIAHTAIALDHLSYAISAAPILKSLTLEIPQGSYFAIAGVNGAGKTTLIKLVLDLIRPADAGRIRLFGADNQSSGCRDQLAYLPEKFDVKHSVTGWAYLRFVASIYHLKLDRTAVAELAEKLDFPLPRLDSKVSGYSKGMVQKLGLISCFMLDRRLLILDEPLSGLDPRARYHFKQLLLEKKQTGLTLLYSTHLLADAEDICDQFGILHDGEMKFIGTPADCMAAYQSGSLEQAYMNCIAKTVV